ncbi:MAG: hypothetical protein AAGJ55_10100, partial [Cyanobacteria bacterium J06555_12]
MEGDALIQWSLQSSSPLLLQAADLHDSSRQWLDAAPLGQLMAIAVDCRPSPYSPTRCKSTCWVTIRFRLLATV